MGFSVGAYARLWSLEDRGNFCVGRISISRKDKQTNQYVTKFEDGYVAFFRDAYTVAKGILENGIPEKGITIKILACDVENHYLAEKKKVYYNFYINAMEIPDQPSFSATSSKNENNEDKSKEKRKQVSKDVEILDDDDDDLPF